MTAVSSPTARSPLHLSRAVRAAVVWLILAFIALSAVYPVVFIAVTTFRTTADYNKNTSGVPRSFTWQNVQDVWTQAHIGSYAINSLLVVAMAVALITASACLAGFAFVHMRLPFRGLGLAIVVSMMIVPPSVLMIPIFKLVVDARLLNHDVALVLVYGSLNLPFSIYLMSSYMRSIPVEVLEAAKIDGASEIWAFRAVALPLVRPGILTLVTLNFLVLWNELLFSLLILQDPSKRTVMVGLAQVQSQYLTSVPLIAAGLLLSIVPPLLIFILFQRDLARGLTAGAVK